MLSALQKMFLPYFSGFSCTQTYVKAFWTQQSVCNIVDGHFSGVPVERGTVVMTVTVMAHRDLGLIYIIWTVLM